MGMGSGLRYWEFLGSIEHANGYSPRQGGGLGRSLRPHMGSLRGTPYYQNIQYHSGHGGKELAVRVLQHQGF